MTQSGGRKLVNADVVDAFLEQRGIQVGILEDIVGSVIKTKEQVFQSHNLGQWGPFGGHGSEKHRIGLCGRGVGMVHPL